MEEPNSASVHQHDDEKNPIEAFFLNLIGAIKAHFPPKIKNNNNNNNGDDDDHKVDLAEPIVIKPPATAIVKLEAGADDAERTANPLLLWQVYAIGGFFIMRWAWTRWNERKGKKKKDDDPHPPSQD